MLLTCIVAMSFLQFAKRMSSKGANCRKKSQSVSSQLVMPLSRFTPEVHLYPLLVMSLASSTPEVHLYPLLVMSLASSTPEVHLYPLLVMSLASSTPEVHLYPLLVMPFARFTTGIPSVLSVLVMPLVP